MNDTTIDITKSAERIASYYKKYGDLVIIILLCIFIIVVYTRPCMKVEVLQTPLGSCVSEYNYVHDGICFYYNATAHAYALKTLQSTEQTEHRLLTEVTS